MSWRARVLARLAWPAIGLALGTAVVLVGECRGFRGEQEARSRPEVAPPTRLEDRAGVIAVPCEGAPGGVLEILDPSAKDRAKLAGAYGRPDLLGPEPGREIGLAARRAGAGASAWAGNGPGIALDAPGTADLAGGGHRAGVGPVRPVEGRPGPSRGIPGGARAAKVAGAAPGGAGKAGQNALDGPGTADLAGAGRSAAREPDRPSQGRPGPSTAILGERALPRLPAGGTALLTLEQSGRVELTVRPARERLLALSGRWEVGGAVRLPMGEGEAGPEGDRTRGRLWVAAEPVLWGRWNFGVEAGGDFRRGGPEFYSFVRAVWRPSSSR